MRNSNKKCPVIFPLKIIVVAISFLFISSESYSNTVTALGGDWSNPSSWDFGVPICEDTIIIPSGVIIDITSTVNYTSCGAGTILIIDGNLRFPVNGPKLRLPCNSEVIINAGGLLNSTGSGGGNTNFIEICIVIVWSKADGDQNGPITFPLAPLPIILNSFHANINHDKVNLNWETSSEFNNAFFTVERSTNLKTWKEILTAEGRGNSGQLTEYFECDYNPKQGSSYYRLKQTDFDGKFTYSWIVPVNYFGVKNSGYINLYPNPVKSGQFVNIEFEEIIQDKLLVVLRDMKGKIFYSKIILKIEDGKLVGLPIESSIPSGEYLVTASSENALYSQKLIIQ